MVSIASGRGVAVGEHVALLWYQPSSNDYRPIFSPGFSEETAAAFHEVVQSLLPADCFLMNILSAAHAQSVPITLSQDSALQLDCLEVFLRKYLFLPAAETESRVNVLRGSTLLRCWQLLIGCEGAREENGAVLVPKEKKRKLEGDGASKKKKKMKAALE